MESNETPHMSNIAYKCRCLKRDKVIVKSKLNKGVVKVAIANGDELVWHAISHISDLKKLFPEHDLGV